MDNNDFLTFEETEKWLKPIKDSSKNNYKHRMRLYIKFSGMNPKELIDEAELDFKKSRRERGTSQNRLIDFYNWLTKEYKKSDRKGGGIGISPYIAKGMVGSLKSFYSRNGFSLGDIDLPRVAPKKENERIEFSVEDIIKMIEVAPSKRDKTLILFGFQGGFDVGTVCKLNLGDIPEGDLNALLENKLCSVPLLLHVVREKEGINYHTCLGFDAVDSLRAYLNERKIRGEKLTLDKPLFVTDGTRKLSGKRITVVSVSGMMRNSVIKAGVVSKERLERADFNTAGYHALRGTFSRRLEYVGMPQAYIDYMQGHTLPHGGAYRKPHPQKLIDKYQEFYHALEVTRGSPELNEIEERLNKELEKEKAYTRSMEERLVELETQQNVIMKVLEKLKV